jgi:hypothetical protein
LETIVATFNGTNLKNVLQGGDEADLMYGH